MVFVKEGVSEHGSWDTNLTLIELPRVLCKFPLRLIIQQCGVPIISWITRAQIVFSLSDIGPIWSPVPVLATLTNAFIYRAFSRSAEFRLSKADLPLLDRIRTRALAVMSRLFLQKVKGLIFKTTAARSEMESLTGKRIHSSVVPYGELHHYMEFDLVQGLRKKQIICVSTIVRYRNQLRLVRAFHELLKTDIRCKEFSLLLIGSVCDAQYASSIREFVRTNQLKEYVRIIGDIPYQEVQDYYSESWGLVFPSMVETYGFPVVEGLFSGIPIAVSDILSFRELARSAAIYFDPNSVDSIRDGLVRLLWDDTLRESLLEAAKVQRLGYSWKTSAERTAKMMEDVLNVDGLRDAREENKEQFPAP